MQHCIAIILQTKASRMLLFSAPLTCSDGGGGLNVFMPWHFIATSCKLMNYVCLFSYFSSQEEERPISPFYMRQASSLCITKLAELGESMLFWTGGVGEVAVCCLSALSSETMEPPVRGKARRCSHATVCSLLLGYCGGGSHSTCFRHTSLAKDMSERRHCVFRMM